jgi:hypothetical protein
MAIIARCKPDSFKHLRQFGIHFQRDSNGRWYLGRFRVPKHKAYYRQFFWPDYPVQIPQRDASRALMSAIAAYWKSSSTTFRDAWDTLALTPVTIKSHTGRASTPNGYRLFVHYVGAAYMATMKPGNTLSPNLGSITLTAPGSWNPQPAPTLSSILATSDHNATIDIIASDVIGAQICSVAGSCPFALAGTSRTGHWVRSYVIPGNGGLGGLRWRLQIDFPHPSTNGNFWPGQRISIRISKPMPAPIMSDPLVVYLE